MIGWTASAEAGPATITASSWREVGELIILALKPERRRKMAGVVSLPRLERNYRSALVHSAGRMPYSPCSAGWSWSGVREKHYYLAGGWRLELDG